MIRLADIHLRDPFVLPVPGEGYYLYGTPGAHSSGPGTGFPVYRSADLETWEGPATAFAPPEGFWGRLDHWAPEVHRYGGRYFLAASFTAEGHRRATQLFVADRPTGPFLPHGEGPVTPPEWECLDGTLWVADDGQPWLVFCHEWLQCHDGEICALPLAGDLSRATGSAHVLFRASQAPGVAPVRVLPDGTACYVTDGPFLWRLGDGGLALLWATMGASGYQQRVAYAASGQLEGPWRHGEKPLLGDDGGHGMVFRDGDGKLRLVLHKPNVSPLERPMLYTVMEEGTPRRLCLSVSP